MQANLTNDFFSGRVESSDEGPKFGIHVVAEPLGLEVGCWGGVLTAGLVLPGDRVHRLRAQPLLQPLLLSIPFVILIEARGGQGRGEAGVKETKGRFTATPFLPTFVSSKDWHMGLH